MESVMMPITSDAIRHENMKIEIKVPNLASSIFTRGISLTLIEPSRQKHIPRPKTHINATACTIPSLLSVHPD
jgi:hypothetical protein